MPSPFPGMDPYLEGDMWQEFHERLANQISLQLLPHLRPNYVALLAKRYVLDRSALGIFEAPTPRILYPDVHVVEMSPLRGGVMEMTSVLTPPTVEVRRPSFSPQLSVEIRDVAQRRLVTDIEILSPANKTGEGVREYADRRVDLLRTRTHLLEIDLLRGGTRIEVLDPLPSAPYYVYLTYGDDSATAPVWAVQLRDRLPTVPVPLLAPDPPVPLNLQAAVASCFALVGYERLLDYIQPPPPPDLSAEDSAWVAETLRELRSGPTA